MAAMKVIAVITLLALISVAHAADWAVIVAGSNTFGNYRHQTDACHAYQVVSKNGIPDERIIVMIYDDIANDPENPFPGKLFNKPTAAGTPGVDVYAGCQKDYTGEDVTAANFLSVLTGDSKAVKGKKSIEE
jgi:legumain